MAEEDTKIPRIPGVSRRDFLKLSAATVVGLALPRGIREVLQSGSVRAPEDYQASGVGVNQAPKQNLENYALPEIETTQRQWEKIPVQEKPPAGYRQASVWHPGRESFIIHGGWGNDGNMNQTWEFKDKEWNKLEEGSTGKLSGHKMVCTPSGIFMYGGVRDVGGGKYQPTNKGYLLDESDAGCSWKEIVFDQKNGELPEARQGMGMVYDRSNNVVWIIGGADIGGISANIGWIRLPDDNLNSWRYQRVRQFDETGTLPYVFEPLVFAVDGKEPIYVYGGLRKNNNILINSASSFRVSHQVDIYNEVIADVAQSGWPEADYAGPVRGGYDPKRGQLVLSDGTSPDFWVSNKWKQSVQYDLAKGRWETISSRNNPISADKTAEAIDMETGNIFRFGGVNYPTAYGVLLDETWVLKPMNEIYLPIVSR